MRGEINSEAFARAWDRVLDRYPVLRSSFVWENVKEPIQIVHKEVPLPLVVYDWREMDHDEQRTQFEALLQIDRHQGFDLSQAPMIRLLLIQLADKEYGFVCSYHHIILDGWSISIMCKEVMDFYEAFCKRQDLQLEPPPRFRDYVAWLRQQDMGKAEAFWRKALCGFVAPTPLPLNRELKTLPDCEEGYDEQTQVLAEATTSALQILVQQKRLTLNVLVQGAWALLLSRYSGKTDVLFGVVSAGRPPHLLGVESMVGLFINTLPTRIIVPTSGRFCDWLKGLQEQQAERQQYEYSPLIRVHAWSDIPQGSMLFESIFTFENYLTEPFAEEGRIETLSTKSFERTHYPLTVMVGPGAALSIRVLYDNRAIEPPAVTRLLDHFEALLSDMAINPDKDIADLAIITATENAHLINDFNASLAM